MSYKIISYTNPQYTCSPSKQLEIFLSYILFNRSINLCLALDILSVFAPLMRSRSACNTFARNCNICSFFSNAPILISTKSSSPFLVIYTFLFVLPFPLRVYVSYTEFLSLSTYSPKNESHKVFTLWLPSLTLYLSICNISLTICHPGSYNLVSNNPQ